MDVWEQEAYQLVQKERERQQQKWGEQNHTPEWWLAILGEEYGETCQAAVEWNFGRGGISAYLEELVQTAAVAVQAIACAKRQIHEAYLLQKEATR